MFLTIRLHQIPVPHRKKPEDPGSNMGPKIGTYNWKFSWYSSPPPPHSEKCWDSRTVP